MAMEEKRMYARVGTVNLISYLVLDDLGNKLSQGMGAALNISPTGLLLQTTQTIDSERISLLSNDIENNLIEIIGKVIYSREIKAGNFETGIYFQGTTRENIQFVKNLVRVFHARKNNHCHPDIGAMTSRSNPGNQTKMPCTPSTRASNSPLLLNGKKRSNEI